MAGDKVAEAAEGRGRKARPQFPPRGSSRFALTAAVPEPRPDLRVERKRGGGVGGRPVWGGARAGSPRPEDPQALHLGRPCSQELRSEGAAAHLPRPGWFSIFGVHSALEFRAAHLKVSQQSSHDDKATFCHVHKFLLPSALGLSVQVVLSHTLTMPFLDISSLGSKLRWVLLRCSFVS